MNLLRKAFADFKFLDSGPGGFEGYASLFDVRDSGGDVVEKGAYERSLSGFLKDGFIGLGHDWAGLAIGTVDEAYEDDKGLYLKATYHSTSEAQAARQVALERLQRGKHVGLSIGYGIAEGGATVKDDGNRHLTDLLLYEVSQVNVPMLRPAGLTSAKGVARDEDDETPGAPQGLKLAEHQERVCLMVPSIVTRWKTLVSPSEPATSHEAKEGRAISTSRRERLGALRDVLRSGADELDGLLVETAPPKAQEPPPSRDGRTLYADYQRTLARLQGVAV